MNTLWHSSKFGEHLITCNARHKCHFLHWCQQYDIVLTEWEGWMWKYLARGHAVCQKIYFPIQPNLTQSISISVIWPPHFSFFFSGNKLYYENVHLGRSFDRKGGINIVTKLFQVASHKLRYAILAGPDGFSGPALTIAYDPHMGIFSIKIWFHQTSW